MALMVNRDAPYSGLSSLMAMQGRYGDTELVHMSKPEIQGLASLGQLTINPETGLPEAFSLKSLLPVIGGIAGSILLPGIGTALGAGALGSTAIGAGIGTTAGGLLAGQKPGEALLGGVTSGLLSFGIGSLLSGAAPGLTETTGELAYGTAAQSADAFKSAYTGLDDIAYATTSGAPTVGQAVTPNVIAPVSYSAAGVPQLAQPAVDLASASGQRLLSTTKPGFFLEKAYEPSTFGKLIGKEAVPAGEISQQQFMDLGGIPSEATFEDIALQKAKNPLTYAPLGIAALTGGLEEPYEYEEPAARPAADTGFGSKTLTGGEVIRPMATEEELRKMALEGGRRNYFTPYRYAAEGGLIGLQQGGMPTPQAPSAMAGMLTQPQPQQLLPINIQVQPQQPVMPQQPQPPMPTPPQQMGSGVAPLPDQQKEFMKLMDMEEQVQGQKQAAALQGTSALAGLLSSAEGMMQQYPQTSPSGQVVQPPPTPPMNYGSQVNLGSTGGFSQGGVIDRAEGGPTRAQFNDFMKSISNTPTGFLLRLSGMDKQIESQLPVGGGGGGAESMNRLLSRDVYSNTSSPATSTQSLGGAASMNQLLARPVYSRQAAEGGIVEYNQGGMPSQGQPYFEGQVEGPGDGQSDEVAFRVDGGQIDGAMLSPDEYVLAADVVSAIGNGSSDAGAAKLDEFMKDVRQDAYGTTKQMQPFNDQGLTNLVA